MWLMRTCTYGAWVEYSCLLCCIFGFETGERRVVLDICHSQPEIIVGTLQELHRTWKIVGNRLDMGKCKNVGSWLHMGKRKKIVGSFLAIGKRKSVGSFLDMCEMLKYRQFA